MMVDKDKCWKVLSKNFCLMTFFSRRLSFFTVCLVRILKFGSPNLWKLHFQQFWITKDIFFIADKHHFPLRILWFGDEVHEIPSPKLALKTPKAALLVGHIYFFCNQTWQGHSVMLSLEFSFLHCHTHRASYIHFLSKIFFMTKWS